LPSATPPKAPWTAWRDTPSPPRCTLGLTIVTATHETRFCRSFGGVVLAYAIDGDGPPMVKASNWLTHLDYERQSRVWPHWVRELSRGRRLIRYDARGCGLSDRQLEGTPTLTPLWAISLRSSTRPLLPRRGRDERGGILSELIRGHSFSSPRITGSSGLSIDPASARSYRDGSLASTNRRTVCRLIPTAARSPASSHRQRPSP
jgi:hypothetical protein